MSDTETPSKPSVGSIKGPTTFGDNSPAIHIERLYQQGKFTDLLAAGKKNLDERNYEWARQAFELYLKGDVPAEALNDVNARAEAFVLCAIATLGGERPDHRRVEQIKWITDYLVNGATHPLAPVLAALVRDDTDAGGIGKREDLAVLAASVSLDQLTHAQLEFLKKHLVPCDGATWGQLRARAQRLGVELPEFTRLGFIPPADQARRIAVEKYFTPDPTKPDEVSPSKAYTLFGIGAGLILAAILTIAIGAKSGGGGGVCFGLLLGAGGVYVGKLGVAAWGRYGVYKNELAAYERAWQRAQPKPSDEQMNDWLAEDIRRIEELGAEKHRLSRRLIAEHGPLVVEPQAIVGRFGSPRLRYGADGKLRADKYRVLTIYLTAERVCVFVVDLDFGSRHVIQERRLTFRYRDIVAIEVSTEPASAEASEEVKRLLNDFVPEAYFENVQMIENERFSLSIVDGDKVSMDMGLSFQLQGYTRDGHDIAWKNQSFLRTVERQVWERQETERR